MENIIPTFIERDPEAIQAECKSRLEELLGREIQPAQIEQLILNFIVYRELLLLNRFNAGMRQMLYQFSTAPILDYIAGLVAIERCPRQVLDVPFGSRWLRDMETFLFPTAHEFQVPTVRPYSARRAMW